MKALFLLCLAVGYVSGAAGAHAASEAHCKHQAILAVKGHTTDEDAVNTITPGKKYVVTGEGEDDEEILYEVTFPDGCDGKPEVREQADDAEAHEEHHSHYGNRCLADEVYRDGQCCKKSGECPPKKPNPHRHDLKR